MIHQNAPFVNVNLYKKALTRRFERVKVEKSKVSLNRQPCFLYLYRISALTL